MSFNREKINEKMIQCVSFERLFLITFIQLQNQNSKKLSKYTCKENKSTYSLI